jgi:hypothetical protein
MDTKMTHAARAGLADAIRRHYRSAAGNEKRRILEQFVAATGYHEKSAIRVLNSEPVPKHRRTHRPSLYDDARRPWNFFSNLRLAIQRDIAFGNCTRCKSE